MKKFIYVFDIEARDYLLSLGYNLLKIDESKKIYIFENANSMSFSNDRYGYVLTDTLYF